VGFFDVAAARLCAGDRPIAALVGGSSCSVERERSLFTMSEHNKYIYKLDSGRLPERNNHHS